MKTKEEYDVHVCLRLQQSPTLAIVQDSRLTMKRIQKRGSDKELRRWNGRDKAWIKREGMSRERTTGALTRRVAKIKIIGAGMAITLLLAQEWKTMERDR